jgi:F-type H+-transporting ATPase subunit epsilon
MSDNTFMLEIITPEEIFLREEVQFVVLPEPDGEVGILKNHSPLVAQLDIGVLRYTDLQGNINKVAISGGFLKVVYNQARVLAETAERGEDIDVLRAKKSLERARTRLRARDDLINYNRAELSLKRAIARLKAAEVNSNI